MIHICGIAGWYSWSNQRLDRDRITKLWEENVFRGRDAAGVAYSNGRQLMYVKEKGTAVDLARALSSETWGNIVSSPFGLLHTRAATQGPASENENNHPVIAYNWVVTHNGVISNDDHLFKHFKTERPARVDTSAINLVLGQGQTVEESLAHAATLRGSATVAAMHVGRMNEMVLFRIGGSPVHLFWLPSMSMLVWSSDGDGYKAIEDKIGGFAGLSAVYGLPDNTALYLTQHGLKRYTLTPKPFGPTYKTYQSYGNTGFFQRPRQTTGKTPTGAKNLLPGQSLAVLRDGKGLLEDPIFQGSRQEYHYLSRYDGYVTKDTTFVLPTGYGRWFLSRTSDGAIQREFKPHRRVRRRWEQEFAVTTDNPSAYEVSLPASAEQAEDLSDLLPLAVVDMVFSDGNKGDALLCPWCGALRHPQGWEMIAFKCEWCGVTSRPPKDLALNARDLKVGGED